MQVDCLCIFEIAQKEIQCESKKVNFEKNILNLGRGGGLCVCFFVLLRLMIQFKLFYSTYIRVFYL